MANTYNSQGYHNVYSPAPSANPTGGFGFLNNHYPPSAAQSRSNSYQQQQQRQRDDEDLSSEEEDYDEMGNPVQSRRKVSIVTPSASGQVTPMSVDAPSPVNIEPNLNGSSIQRNGSQGQAEEEALYSEEGDEDDDMKEDEEEELDEEEAKARADKKRLQQQESLIKAWFPYFEPETKMSWTEMMLPPVESNGMGGERRKRLGPEIEGEIDLKWFCSGLVKLGLELHGMISVTTSSSSYLISAGLNSIVSFTPATKKALLTSDDLSLIPTRKGRTLQWAQPVMRQLEKRERMRERDRERVAREEQELNRLGMGRKVGLRRPITELNVDFSARLKVESITYLTILLPDNSLK